MRVTVSETLLVLQAPTPFAVKVKISGVQLLLADWNNTGVPVENVPNPFEELQVGRLPFVTLDPTIAKGVIGTPEV